MSARLDNSVDNSREDSIPIDDRSVSGSEYEYDSDYDSESRSSVSGSQTGSARSDLRRSRDSGLSGPSEYTQTSYMYGSSYGYDDSAEYDSGYAYDNSGYDYDSGYNSGYLDGSLSYTYASTSRSRSNSFMNSTFNKLYYDNPVMRSVRHFLRTYSRPLFFVGFSTIGSGAAAKLFQFVRTFYKPLTEPVFSTDAAPSVAAAISERTGEALKSTAPQWLRELRMSIPSIVESPVTWWLHRKGIPILSELQKEAQSRQEAAAFAAAATAASRDAVATEATPDVEMASSAMLPATVLLPVFTLIVLRVARHAGSRRQPRFDGSDFDMTYYSGGDPASEGKSPFHGGGGQDDPSALMGDSNIQDDDESGGDDSRDGDAIQDDSIDIMPPGNRDDGSQSGSTEETEEESEEGEETEEGQSGQRPSRSTVTATRSRSTGVTGTTTITTTTTPTTDISSGATLLGGPNATSTNTVTDDTRNNSGGSGDDTSGTSSGGPQGSVTVDASPSDSKRNSTNARSLPTRDTHSGVGDEPRLGTGSHTEMTTSNDESRLTEDQTRNDLDNTNRNESSEEEEEDEEYDREEGETEEEDEEEGEEAATNERSSEEL